MVVDGLGRALLLIEGLITICVYLICCCAQVPILVSTLTTILNVSNANKTEACIDLDKIEGQLETADVTKLMNCSGNFTLAYRIAKVLCQSPAECAKNATLDDKNHSVTSSDKSPNVTSGDISSNDNSGGSNSTCKLNICNVAKAQVLFMYANNYFGINCGSGQLCWLINALSNPSACLL